MARVCRVQLTQLDEPAPRHSPHRTAHDHLEKLLATNKDLTGFAKAQARQAYRLARHLAQVDAIGAQIEADNVAEIERLTGVRFSNQHEAEQALETYIGHAPGAQDTVLIPLLHRMIQRRHMLLGLQGSRIRRHPALQSQHR